MICSMKRLISVIAFVAILSPLITTSIAYAQPPPPADPSA